MGNAAVLWLGPIFLLAAKEHKQLMKWNDVDDDDAGATATSDVTIAINNNATTAAVDKDDMDASVGIGVMTAMTILLMMAPANVTIRWMMLMNDDGNDVQNGNDGHKTSLPPTKKVTTTAMTTTEMTSATIPSKMMGPFLPPPIADNSWTCRLPALCQTCSPLTTLADPTAANPQRLCPPPVIFT